MENQDYKEIFYGFLNEYAAFFEEMVNLENEKLGALLSNNLAAIERSISVHQATEKRLENLERRRAELQTAAGFGGKTFYEIIGLSPAEKKQELQLLFNRVEQAISQIKYLNGKSMAVARDNLQGLAKRQHNTQLAKGYSQSGESGSDTPQGGTLLKTKV